MHFKVIGSLALTFALAVPSFAFDGIPVEQSGQLQDTLRRYQEALDVPPANWNELVRGLFRRGFSAEARRPPCSLTRFERSSPLIDLVWCVRRRSSTGEVGYLSLLTQNKSGTEWMAQLKLDAYGDAVDAVVPLSPVEVHRILAEGGTPFDPAKWFSVRPRVAAWAGAVESSALAWEQDFVALARFLGARGFKYEGGYFNLTLPKGSVAIVKRWQGSNCGPAFILHHPEDKAVQVETVYPSIAEFLSQTSALSEVDEVIRKLR